MKRNFDDQTGAVFRDFKNFNEKSDKGRGYGKTKAYDDHPFIYPSINLIIGKIGSGKSMCMLNILDEITNSVDSKKFNKIIYYSGSPGDKSLENLDEDIVTIYNPETTQSLLDELRTLKMDSMSQTDEEKKITVLVLDDVSANASLCPTSIKNSEIGDYFVGARHMKLIIYLLVQRVKGVVSPWLLSNLSHMFIFPGCNKKDEEELVKNTGLPTKQLTDLLSSISSKPYNFLHIDLKSKTAGRCFSEIILK